MREIFINLGFDNEELEDLLIKYEYIGVYKLEKIILLLSRYGCNKIFLKELIINRTKVFEYDVDQLEYILDAIVSNGDCIEETLLEIL